MKLFELLRESVQQQVINDLQDLLVNYKAQGKTSIDTQSVVSQMSRMGHTLSPESVMHLVAEMPMQVVADETQITLDTGADANDSGEEDSADAVSRMAKKAVDKEL